MSNSCPCQSCQQSAGSGCSSCDQPRIGMFSSYHAQKDCGRHSCNTCNSTPCQQSHPSLSTPCDPPPEKPVYCNSCNRGLIIVQPNNSVSSPTTLPPLATNSSSNYPRTTDDAGGVDLSISNGTNGNGASGVPQGMRTLVGTLNYNPTSNTWRLRHLGLSADDKRGGEVILRGIEPFADSLRDKLTVSVRGELVGNSKTTTLGFNVSDVNIVGQ